MASSQCLYFTKHGRWQSCAHLHIHRGHFYVPQSPTVLGPQIRATPLHEMSMETVVWVGRVKDTVRFPGACLPESYLLDPEVPPEGRCPERSTFPSNPCGCFSVSVAPCVWRDGHTNRNTQRFPSENVPTLQRKPAFRGRHVSPLSCPQEGMKDVAGLPVRVPQHS